MSKRNERSLSRVALWRHSLRDSTQTSPVFPSAASIATYYIAWISRYFSCWTTGTGYQLFKGELNPHLPTISVCSIIALRLLPERLVRTRSGSSSTLQVKLEVNVSTIVNGAKTEIKQHSNEENRQKTQPHLVLLPNYAKAACWAGSLHIITLPAPPFNPLHPKISTNPLPTVLYTCLKDLTRRICSTIKSFFSWWSFPLFLWPSGLTGDSGVIW